MARILLIDDDDAIRELYRAELRQAGLDVDAYSTGKECLSALAAKTYDLVLLDIMLPDSNGLELVKKIKGDAKNKSLVIVFITNLGQEDILNQGLALGAAGYLVKLSYNPDQFVAEVKKYLPK